MRELEELNGDKNEEDNGEEENEKLAGSVISEGIFNVKIIFYLIT